MCEYFGITPAEFFAEENQNPILLNQLNEVARSLSDDEVKLLIDMAERLSQSPKKR